MRLFNAILPDFRSLHKAPRASLGSSGPERRREAKRPESARFISWYMYLIRLQTAHWLALRLLSLGTLRHVYSTVENKHTILLQSATAAPGRRNVCTCIFKMFQSFSPRWTPW